MGYVTAICSAVAAVFNWATGRSNLNNAPAVQAAKVAQAEVDAKAKTNTAIENRNTKEIQNEISE